GVVDVAGCEPFGKDGVYPRMERCRQAGRTVLLETGGHVPLDRVDPRVIKIVDVKAPGSGMHSVNRLENLGMLTPSDELKFVLSDRSDFDWALNFVSSRDLDSKNVVTFS